MKPLSSELFFRSAMKRICSEKKMIVDIGGGLRIRKDSEDRFESQPWLEALIARVQYFVLYIAPEHHPDIVGDIHELPFAESSQEAIICIAVLEHVENPFRAMHEMYRTLQTGGYLLLYVPWLYYFHAEGEHYKDYWRFSSDALRLLGKDFSHMNIEPVRGPLETWLHLNPLRKTLKSTRLGRFVRGKRSYPIARYVDRFLARVEPEQVSGYYALFKK
jgi:SAM-dependent methyltransferase